MKKLLIFFAAILLALSAFAADVLFLTSDIGTLTLQNTPCNSAVKAILQPKYRDKFRNAKEVQPGLSIKACWFMNTPKTIVVVYEDGDSAVLPLTVFTRVGEAKPAKDSV